MSAPTIDAAQGYLGYSQYQAFDFQPGIDDGGKPVTGVSVTGLPLGMSVAATPSSLAATGVASTDVVTATGHTFANGDPVFFVALTGGDGLAIDTTYYVINSATNTLKLAATPGGAAIDFTTDISAATVRAPATGLISCDGTTKVGEYNLVVRATNADGTSSAVNFFVAIAASDGSEVVDGGSDLGIDLDWDIATGIVTPTYATITSATSAATDPVAELKSNDVRLLNIHLKKAGKAVDPDPTHLKLICKEFDTEAPFVLAGGDDTTFTKVGTGVTAVFKLPVDLTGDDVLAALSDFESTKATEFTANTELELRQTTSAIGGVTAFIVSSRSFPVQMVRDLSGD